MPRFTMHMSKAVAGATVNGMEAITATIQAAEREGAARLECLYEARGDLMEFLGDIDKAISAEIAAQPKASPTVERIRSAARGDDFIDTIHDILRVGAGQSPLKD